MEIIKTEDGSVTIYLKELDETYHSRHGAIQEAMHVFIQNGLNSIEKKKIRIFEMGFGTGLNAFLTYLHSKEKEIEYTGLELHPVPLNIIEEVNYWQKLNAEKEDFLKFHQVEWESFQPISSTFKLRKMKGDLRTFESKEEFDLIYFDAFGPRAQEAMWEKEILEKIVSKMAKGSVFVTYCAKGQVRRDLIELGLDMHRIPGPPGKREMLVGFV